MEEDRRTQGERRYDSKKDTLAHIVEVRSAIMEIVGELHKRAAYHDRSKLEEPEKSMFDEVTPRLRGLTYDSPEYKAMLEEMLTSGWLKHHYEHNRHHPEHFPDGLFGMTLVDLIEMFCDWYAAGKRHNDGDIIASIQKNKERFGYDELLAAIFENTAVELGWTRVPAASVEA